LTEGILSAEARHLIRGHQQIWEKSGIAIERGNLATLRDTQGRSYIDLWAGGGVCSVGHAHPEFTHAVHGQLLRGIVGSHPSAARSAYVGELAAALPAPLTKIQLYTSGAEAVEAALRLARSYTGRPGFLSFNGSFHGKTLGALSLSDWDQRDAYAPLAPGFAMAPYPVADPAGRAHGERLAADSCLDAARAAVATLGRNSLAGIVVEPVQGTAGNHFPADGFLDGLRALALETGALLIFDEIITGFGRTGRLFASGSRGPVPDIMVIGKGMGNGMPVSGIATTDVIGESLPFAGPSGSSTSYGGNPLSAAAASATLGILQREAMPASAAKVGAQLLSQLSQGLAGNPFVTGPWGEGLLIGMELTDPRSGGRLAREHCERVFRELLRSGVLIAAYTPTVRINPPLCLTPDEAEEAAGRIIEVLGKISLPE
jgi:4-aminobutyrate aminotransferase/(S)-3-amino-2-methylpropionate transaminase